MRANLASLKITTLAGSAVLLALLAACGSTDPRVPAAIVLDATSLTFSSLGEAQQLTPTITDQDGKSLPPETANWTSSNPGVATVTQTGLVTAVGSGSAQITAEAGAASASAQVSVAQTPTAIVKVSGDEQTAPAGSTLPAPLVVQVNDARGNPVPNVTVVFTVLEGDGSTSSATALTGPDGRAATTFTTGTISGSSQVVSVTIQTTALSVSFTATAAADPTGFNIGVRFLTPATPAQRQAFTDARLRWEAAISGDIEDGFLQAPAGDCATGSPAVSQDIDDLLILVNLVEIDGEGGVLGGAGPCYIRTAGDLTILGTMQFDTADLEMLEAEGFLSNVILHEMGHVLGFGTLWDLQGLLVDPAEGEIPNPSADPHFIGPQAIAAFDDVGGTTYVDGAKVPVENTGGPGTADGHWRESVFDRELMTGFIGSGTSPLSIVTLNSLADQGYVIDFTKADGYTLALALQALDIRKQLPLKNDILRMPVRRVDSRGRVTSVLR